ncbi:hypothetical protein VB005_08109, partial [Metarhizium brunneum]
MYLVEASLSASQDEMARCDEQHEEDMHKLRTKVYVLEEKVHVLQEDMLNSRQEHYDFSQELRAELHRTRELLHQITGDIQVLKDNERVQA